MTVSNTEPVLKIKIKFIFSRAPEELSTPLTELYCLS